jgi:excisionase family DNA binding protein
MNKIETITPNEIAAILRIHPFTVTRLAREGKLPGFKVGGIWRFRKDQFEQWINAQSRADRNKSKRVRRAKVRV